MTNTVDRSLAELSSWEKWVNSFFGWMPYAALGVSLVLAQFGAEDTPDRLTSLALVVAAAAWTWLTFTRNGAPTQVAQRFLYLYFIGFAGLAALLIFSETVFIVYAITGFFHAYLLRPWPLAVIGIAAAGFLVHSHIVITESTSATWAIYLGVVAFQTLAVAAGFYGGQKITEIAEERRRTLENLELAMEENAGLHAQLVAQAREAGVLDERQRLAGEIHDTIAQGLTGVITQIEAINQFPDDAEELRRRLDTAAELARQSLSEARRSVQALRPGQLDSTRLPEALSGIVSRWSEVTGVAAEAHTTGEARPLHPEIEVTLLRAAQEGLANVAKHAAATRAGVTLSFMDDSVALDIRDDGTGFDVGAAPSGQSFGLAAMRHRVRDVHGTMYVESAPGDGTAVSVRIPDIPIGEFDG